MNSKYILYFLLAVLPSLISVQTPPSTNWDWFKLIGQSLYQGLLAMKALQSIPATDTTDETLAPTKVLQKVPLAILIALGGLTFFFCSACVTTTTKNPDGSTTTVTRQDPKVVKELEPIFQSFGAGATQGALQFLKDEQGNQGPNGQSETTVKIITRN